MPVKKANSSPSFALSDARGNLSRRDFVAGLSLAASLPFLDLSAAAGQAPPRLLPLNTPKIDHLDVIVPNVEASARFYMGVFNTTLHAQPFQRLSVYFVLFGEPAGHRQVGIWPSATRADGDLHRPLLHVVFD